LIDHDHIRRQLLQGAMGLALAPWQALANAPNLGQFLGGGRFVDRSQNDRVYVYLALLDADKRQLQRIASNHFPHGICADPTQPNRVISFEKIGPGAAEYDLAAQKLTRAITAAPGHWFYGHGVFSRDGQLLFATETALDSKTGRITVREGKSLQIVGDFPTFGANPHDCLLSADGKTLIVTNAGTPTEAASLCFIDMATQQLR
jgi:uncharacterized protein